METLTVDTGCGKVSGRVVENGVIFSGIPYAEAERFELPVEIKKWDGILDCTESPLEFLQMSSYADDSGRFFTKEFRPGAVYEYAESPLTLTVITPEKAEKCPVFVFIHGGGFHTGKQSELPFGTSTEYAKRGIILVSISYRMNVFGLYRQRNLCLWDQITAVKWVSRNIAAFGGDPEKIIVGGQSAGAMSVMTMLYNDQLKGIIKGAVMMSGGGFIPSFASPWDARKAKPFWDKVEKTAGCSSEAELKKLPAEKVWKAWTEVRKTDDSVHLLQAGCDGILVPDTPSEIRKTGNLLDIPVLIGVTSQDMYFSPLIFGIAKSFALWSAKRNREEVYAYLFDRIPPGKRYKAFHGSDLWYAFGNMDKSWRPFSEKDFQIRDEMVDSFAQFIKTGSPGWPGISAHQKKFRYFGDRSFSMISGFCAFPTLLRYSTVDRGPM